jgi:hypothetical protein
VLTARAAGHRRPSNITALSVAIFRYLSRSSAL